MIRKEMLVADVVKLYPGAIDLFNREHVDYCCGGRNRLEDALTDKGVVVDEFVGELNDTMAQSQNRYRNRVDETRYAMSIAELIDTIESTHHVEERQLLGQLDRLLNKVLIAHFERHGDELLAVHRLFADLKKELEEHFVLEEKIDFPGMRSLPDDAAGIAEVRRRLERLEGDHVAVGDMLKRLRTATHDFTAPADACPSYLGAYALLQRLVEDLFMHVFYENTVLFPKVVEKLGE